MVDAARFIRSLCVLVQIVGAYLQERNQGFHILQIQSDAVTIQRHFPQIGSHAADTKLIHLLMDSLDLLFGFQISQHGRALWLAPFITFFRRVLHIQGCIQFCQVVKLQPNSNKRSSALCEVIFKIL